MTGPDWDRRLPCISNAHAFCDGCGRPRHHGKDDD